MDKVTFISILNRYLYSYDFATLLLVLWVKMISSNHVRAMSLLGPIDSIERSGFSSNALLRDIDIPVHSITDSEATINDESYLNFLNRCKEVTADNLFLFHTGMSMNIEQLGLYGMAILSASTVREALGYARYTMQYLQDGGDLHIETRVGRCTLTYEHKFKDRLSMLDVDYTIGAVASLLINANTNISHDLRLYFPSAQNSTVIVPGHTVQAIGSQVGMISFDEQLLNCRMPFYNSMACHVLERFHAMNSGYLKNDQSLQQTVEHLLLASFGIIKPTLKNMTYLLGINERKLQRRLEQNGVTFSDILQKARKNAALLYISKGDDIIEIALKLGYNYPGNFSAAFHSWFGCSPTKLNYLKL